MAGRNRKVPANKRATKRGARVVPLHDGRRRRAEGSGRRLASRTDRREARGARVGRGRLRVAVGVVAVVCVSFGLSGRAVQLSVAEDQRYRDFAPGVANEAQAAEGRPDDEAGRGAIVSADGRQLATSLDAAKVIATPYQIEHPKATAEYLVDVLGDEAEDAGEVEAKLAEKDDAGSPLGYSVVAEGIEPEKAREVAELGLAGITVAPDEERVYPNGPMASQLLGFLGTDRAYGGVEARYEDVLESGQDVRLTLDTAVQDKLEGAIAEAAEKYEGKNALGLVMRVEDGAIVALAHAPGYDNNDFAEAPEEDKRDRALTDAYEPGSTFKAFTMAAALDEGAIDEGSTFVVGDSLPVADAVIRDSHPHATEVMTPEKILEESSNVGTIQVAQALGSERLAAGIKGFGFGEGTGVDLLGENPGLVPPVEGWSGTSIGNIPIGQGLTVTPLQLASGYAALANGGRKVTPHVSEASTGAPGERVISEGTSSIVRGMLGSVVENGTGHLARIPGYTVAGKTGTAQKVDPETGLYGDEYITSFIGFAPATDPEYLTLVIVDEPQKEIWGELVAAPAFREVMSFSLGYFNVVPDDESSKNDDPPTDPPLRPGTIKTRGWAP